MHGVTQAVVHVIKGLTLCKHECEGELQSVFACITVACVNDCGSNDGADGAYIYICPL